VAEESSDPVIEERLDAFRAAIAPDLYVANVFVPWDMVDETVRQLSRPIALLQAWADRTRVSVSQLAEAIAADSGVLRVLQFLFVAPSEVGFAMRRSLIR
jgi:hypothetical protein